MLEPRDWENNPTCSDLTDDSTKLFDYYDSTFKCEYNPWLCNSKKTTVKDLMVKYCKKTCSPCGTSQNRYNFGKKCLVF